MSGTHKLRLPLALAMTLVLLGVAACKRDAEAPAATTGAQAPVAGSPVQAEGGVLSLRVATLDGGQFDLAEHRGQWVLVNFWATWCSPCLKEMPELSALDAMREHISVVGLAQEDISADEMRAFLEKHPVVYPIAIVGLEQSLPGFDAPTGLPMTYLVAPDGTLAKRYAGVLSATTVEADIAELGGPAPGA